MIPRLLPRISSLSSSSSSSSSHNTFLRHYSIRSSSSSLNVQQFHRAFNWKPLVGPHTSPATIEVLKEIDSKLSKLSSEIMQATDSVPKIDWTHYSKLIKNRPALHHVFKRWLLDTSRNATIAYKTSLIAPPELQAFNKSMDAIIAEQKSLTQFSEVEAGALRKHIIDLEYNHAYHGEETPVTDLLELPGMEEQLNREYESGEFLPTDAEDAVTSVDPKALRTIIEKGGNIESVFTGKVPINRLGDYKVLDEWNKVKALEAKVLASDKDAKKILPEEFPFELDENPYADEKDEEHH